MDTRFQIPINAEKKRHKLFSIDTLKDIFISGQLKGAAGFLFLLSVSLFFAYAVARYGMVPGVLILGMLIGVPIIYGLIFYPRFGIIVFLVAAYFLMWIGRMKLIQFPLGTLMDGMEVLFILGLFIQMKKDPTRGHFKGAISTVIFCWILYNLLEVLNPYADSQLAWVYTVRTVAVVMLTYFVFVYNIRTKAFIKIIIKLWLGLSLFAALYAFKQQYIGFFAFEEAYLNSDPNIANLLFIGGEWRKFSIFSDPVSFSYNMVVSSLLCIGLMTGPLSKAKKIGLGILTSLFLLAMLFSGTRGAYVLTPVALILFAILNYNKKVMIAAVVFGAIMLVLIFIPTSNYTLFRFQSAFKPSDDASFNVRKINQKRIQPFIQSHPLGGGLGSTGEWGERFSPGSFLASFPPDSGYVRVAVEMGWLGLLIFCTLIFIILRTGIINYYAIRDPELKSYCLSMVLVVFAFHVGNYPQEALVQFPSNVYFYLVTAIIVVTRRIDNEQKSLSPINYSA